MAEKRTSIATPIGRLLFPHFFEPYAGIENAKPKYSAVLVFEPGTDLTELTKLVAEAAQQLKSKAGARNPIRSGDEKAEDWGEVFKGAKYIRVSSDLKPAVVDAARKIITEEEGKEKVYSGCYARLSVHCYPYDKAGNKGVAFGFNAVQIVKDGEALGGAQAAVKLFDDGKVSAPAAGDPFADEASAPSVPDDPFAE